ncbi:MAG: NAD(P)/FAD-dependent oxidoreductase [Aquabacterium sp.]|uniref:NAD(P)/FAD-dependent oxidoreductase n=1 Tax=Caldimonas manganoxidans TaxID=196015 RepID=UPI000361CD6A|nr:NAD(P)/FAD-dependent oxidoreductase [Caldimonas manganoxidans]
MTVSPKNVVIIGAGPAGLTAAHELITRSHIKPIILEADTQVGGISKTIEYRGNRMDLGGHRFFSKSDWVMQWWQALLPVRAPKGEPVEVQYHGKKLAVTSAGARDDAACLLVRPRLSRIYFLRRFFDYPLKLNWTTIANLGAWRLVRILFSYAWAQTRRRPEKSLEDFIINRFGGELYRTFFKDYTEKVWGVPCSQISAEWGAQRIKSLSIAEALKHAIGTLLPKRASPVKHTSLIEQFLYPPLGPGQMWEAAADKIRALGGRIEFGVKVVGVRHANGRVVGVEVLREGTQREFIAADEVISTMPVRDLVRGMSPAPPPEVLRIADGLLYRDFITVGVLVRKLKPSRYAVPGANTHVLPDNWIYVQEKEVKLGRLQIFNNWSPALVQDQNTVWLGLEYFCNEGDALWSMPKEEFAQFAIRELASIDLIDPSDVMDWNVVHVEKAYPAYFGTYDQFGVVRQWLDTFGNLYLVGRNGMHRYNNQDHSMLTGKLAAEAIMHGHVNRAEIWAVNIDDEYHEMKVDRESPSSDAGEREPAVVGGRG